MVTAKLEPAVHPGNGLYAIGSSHESFACIFSGRQLIKQKLAVFDGGAGVLMLYCQFDEPDVQRLYDE